MCALCLLRRKALEVMLSAKENASEGKEMEESTQLANLSRYAAARRRTRFVLTEKAEMEHMNDAVQRCWHDSKSISRTCRR